MTVWSCCRLLKPLQCKTCWKPKGLWVGLDWLAAIELWLDGSGLSRGAQERRKRDLGRKQVKEKRITVKEKSEGKQHWEAISVFRTRTEKKEVHGNIFLVFSFSLFYPEHSLSLLLSILLLLFSESSLSFLLLLHPLLYLLYLFLSIMLDAAFRCLKYFLSSWSVKQVSRKMFKLKRRNPPPPFFITTEWFLDSILYPKGTLTSLHYPWTFSPSDPTFCINKT